MRYKLIITPGVKRGLRLLLKNVRQSIGYKIYLLQEDLTGDVKKLEGSANEYRLRVGNYRVIFDLKDDTIFVFAVGDRKNIYR